MPLYCSEQGKEVFLTALSPGMWEIQVEVSPVWQAGPSPLKCNLQRALLYLESLNEWTLEPIQRNILQICPSMLTKNRLIIVLGGEGLKKNSCPDAEWRRSQKVRMFLYKDTAIFTCQGCLTSVEIQALCWFKEQVSIPCLYLFSCLLWVSSIDH